MTLKELKINERIVIEDKIFQIKRMSMEPWFCLQETLERDCQHGVSTYATCPKCLEGVKDI